MAVLAYQKEVRSNNRADDWAMLRSVPPAEASKRGWPHPTQELQSRHNTQGSNRNERQSQGANSRLRQAIKDVIVLSLLPMTDQWVLQWAIKCPCTGPLRVQSKRLSCLVVATCASCAGVRQIAPETTNPLHIILR